MLGWLCATESVDKRGKREGKRSFWHGRHSRKYAYVCVCVRVQYDVTLMWFKGWKAEMKQSVLDRNAWLAESLLRQKQKRDKTGSGWKWKRWNVALHEKKKNSSTIWKQNKKITKRQERVCCAIRCFCIFQNKLQLNLRYIQPAL